MFGVFEFLFKTVSNYNKMEFSVDPRWLFKAVGKNATFQVKPQLSVSDGQLKVTTFKLDGNGMRASHKHISCKQDCTIEVPQALRGYLHQLTDCTDIQLILNDTTLRVCIERPTFGIEYQIPKVIVLEDYCIETSLKDVHHKIGTRDWMAIGQAMPAKGYITFQCQANKKMITFKHSKGRWGGAIAASEKSKVTKTFRVDSGVAKFCFKGELPTKPFCTLIFMECGVLKWICDDITIHLAPQAET